LTSAVFAVPLCAAHSHQTPPQLETEQTRMELEQARMEADAARQEAESAKAQAAESGSAGGIDEETHNKVVAEKEKLAAEVNSLKTANANLVKAKKEMTAQLEALKAGGAAPSATAGAAAPAASPTPAAKAAPVSSIHVLHVCPADRGERALKGPCRAYPALCDGCARAGVLWLSCCCSALSDNSPHFRLALSPPLSLLQRHRWPLLCQWRSLLRVMWRRRPCPASARCPPQARAQLLLRPRPLLHALCLLR
jgi:hypothetical protein